MENQKYTMEDITQFLIDYKECNKYNSKEWLINIPIIGGKLYEKVILENMKRINKTVFGSLRNTLNTSWQNNIDNHTISISTPYKNYIYQIKIICEKIRFYVLSNISS